MEFITLRRAGGSLTMTIPRAFVRALGLAEGAQLGVSLAEGRLIAEPVKHERPAYTLDELLAQCDPAAPLSDEDEAWLNDRPVGAELI
jgi:antitoxin ChpS